DIQMVQDGVSPYPIKRLIGERQMLGIRLEKIDGYGVSGRSLSCLSHVSARKINASDSGSAARENDRRHAVPATIVQNLSPLNFPKFRDGKANPRLVIQIFIVTELESLGRGRKCRSTARRLDVVKRLFSGQPRRTRHVRHTIRGMTS